MEQAMTRGASLSDIAQSTSYEANAKGYDLTGAMYGAAVAALVEVWKHGEELRRWHNMKMSAVHGPRANEEGGIIDPSILVLPDKT